VRLHIGVSPGGGKSHGQAAIIFTEHRETAPEEARIAQGPGMLHTVVHIERQAPILEVVRDRIVEIAGRAEADRPCIFLDAAGGLGAGLAKILADLQRAGKFPAALHRPHAYTQRGQRRQGLVNAIVEVYGGDRLRFAPSLPLGPELIKALETYESEVADDGRVSFAGDEGMVLALGLSLAYARHGARPRYVSRSGIVWADRAACPDPY